MIYVNLTFTGKVQNYHNHRPPKVCSSSFRYIGETRRNAEVRWNEGNNPTKSSEPSKHLPNNFIGTIISNAPKNAKTRKNLEALYIVLWKPGVNEQKDFERLVLFRNGVT